MDKNEMKEQMAEKKSGIFKLVEGLKPVDASALAEYEREMTQAIPEIVKDVENRRMLAAESRQRRLAMPTSDKPAEPQK